MKTDEQKSRFTKTKDWATRGFAAASILLLGWTTVGALQTVFAARNVAALKSADKKSAIAAQRKIGYLPMLPPEGRWTFEGMSWSPADGRFLTDDNQESLATPHLAPLPVGARRAAARWSNDGLLLLEVVSLTAPTTGGQLTEVWTSQGWRVEPTLVSGSHQFSVLLARDGVVRYAWSAEPPAALTTVMLVDPSPSLYTQASS